MVAIYKCKRCGKRYGSFHTGRNLARTFIVGISINDMSILKHLNVWADRFEPHYCEDDGIGLAEFIGFDTEEGETTDAKP